MEALRSRTSTWWLRPLLAAALLLASVAPAAAGDDEAPTIDYLALGARLLRDGHADRAERALDQVDEKDPKLDRQRLYTLRGLAALSQQQFEPAAAAFRAAIAAPPPAGEVAPDGDGKRKRVVDPMLRMYLARALFGAEKWKAVLEVLDRAGKTLDDEPSIFTMRAQASWQLERPDAALAALHRGQRLFPQRPEFLRTEVFYLVELQLFQRATEVGQHYLDRQDASAEDYVAVAEALRRGGQAERAGLLLEQAHLRYPDDTRVMLALSHTYIDRERPLSAAMVLEEAARRESRFLIEAAELYRRAGRHARALSLNEGVHDQAAKFRQRLSILVDMEAFERVGGMAPTLDRLALLRDDQVRYALAYALYKVGDFEGAERHLKRLTEASLLDSVGQLRKAMAACKADGWQCS